jgi:nitrate reductase beta subunit
MPKVKNWQLGRDMEFPLPDARPKRQFAAIFNINRCIGCQTCTMACKSTWTFSPGQEFMWWNNVESKPYGGYPHNWDVKLLAQLGPQGWQGDWLTNHQYTGETIFEAAARKGQQVLGYLPNDSEWTAPNIYEDTSGKVRPEGAKLPEHTSYFFYLQRICNHCSYPACLAACPRQAIYKRKEDGIVLIDQKRCRGYRKCVEACPYKKPMYRSTTRVSEKCIACYPRIEDNTVTRCVAVCVGKIRLQGWLEDERSPIHYLVYKAKVALPLYPQFGTEPNVYYIPPRWAPRAYLHQMFGPGVEDALAAYARPSPELLGVLQLFGATQKIIETYQVTDKDAIGFDKAGKEIVRVPIQDAVIVRPPDRFNTT